MLKPGADAERARWVAALSDGRPVDWAEARALHPELTTLIDSLSSLEGIAGASRDALRALAREGAGESPEGDAAPVAAWDASGREAMFSWGSLRVLSRIGSGAFGDVFRAFDPALQREVALKLWRADAAPDPEVFLVEARRLARVRHPNVLAVHGVDLRDGRLGMWTDLLEAQTLEQVIAAEGPMEPREAAVIGIELCRAVAAVHAADLLHRDIKATNVMRERDGRIVLLDFGAVADRPAPGSGAGSNRVLGTPMTMAPEQFFDERLTPAADVYGVGCLLYRLTTGRHPIEPASMAELRERSRRGAITPLRERRPELPAAFCRIVERSLAARATDRFATASALERALATWLSSEKRSARPRRAAARPSESGGTPRPRRGPPSPLTSFVGRRREAAACRAQLESVRLLTLTGPGGCGKTRLAVHLAQSIHDAGERPVAFVDLVSIENATRLPLAVASALDVREERDRDLLDTLADHLQSSEVLVVLDNCETLVAPCARLVAHLLRHCPRVGFLVTSRELLGAEGEHVFVVPPLSLPESAGPAGAGDPERSDAVQLFLERAAAVRADFTPTRSDLDVVGRIVRSLDGLPLAIELAAARMRVLSHVEILERLGDRFRLLTADSSTSLRHSTLRATIQWSYDLLDPPDARLLRSLSVLAGGGTLAAARAVEGEARDEIGTLEGLTHLVDKSLVVVERTEAGTTRYRLLETVRQFALEMLAGAEEAGPARARHLDYFLALAERADAEFRGPKLATWLDALEHDHENLLGALETAETAADGVQRSLRLAGALAGFWQRRGHFRVGEAALARALERPGADAPTRPRALALFGAVRLAVQLRGARLPRRDLANLEECLALFRRFDDRRGIAATLNQKAFIAHESGDTAGARAAVEESLVLARETGDRWLEAGLLNNLGEMARVRGDSVTARARYLEAIAVGREAGDAVRIAILLANVAVLDAQRGEPAVARTHLAESLRHVANVEAPVAACTAVHAAAVVASVFGEHEAGARWFGAADAQWKSIGSGPQRADAEAFAPILAGLRRALGVEAFAAAQAEGAALTLKAALEEARDWVE